MATTIRTISEQVSKLYSRNQDKENSNTKLNWKEVKPIVVQEINNVMGITLINLNEMDVGVNITSGMLARYRVPVLTRGTGADQEWYSKLPAYPIRLKNNLGLFRVGPVSSFKAPYVIVPELYWDLLDQLEESDLEGNVGVIPAGDNEIIYSKDPGVTAVMVSLVVCDNNTFGDNDVLPITAELETVVRDNAVKLFNPEIMVEKDIQEQPVTE
jgi:hypothetical protein